MLNELIDAKTAPLQMFPTRNPQMSARLMATMDSLNGRFGRGMVRSAVSGVDRRWTAKAEYLSPPLHNAPGRDCAGAGLTAYSLVSRKAFHDRRLHASLCGTSLIVGVRGPKLLGRRPFVAENKVTTFPAKAEPKRQDIVAAQKIIADISSGVYRSPGAAIKELVANAYDADATRVTITTDPPHLRSFTITDDGSGMTINDFLDVMAHIGGSRKRVHGDTSPIYKRKLIGRIGIGLLSVAQLGTKFYLSSKKKGAATRFLAEVNLEPFHKDETALLSMKSGKDGEVTIGAIRYVDEIPDDPDSHFTVISVPDAKKGLSSEMTGLVRKAVGATDVLSIDDGVRPFAEIIDVTASTKRADLVLDNYFYMLWELGLLCPVDYLGGSPFDELSRNIVDLASLVLPEPTRFNVLVDGVAIYRSMRFPNPRAIDYSSPDPKLYPLRYDKVISQRRLRLYGYVYCQQPGIAPEEVKGVHIRIKNVGIGAYDRTWLGYPFDEGLKFGQITGEIFVEEGLESALNIDRDSFRETDVHYQALRAYVWNELRKTLFPDFKQRQKAYRTERKAEADAAADVVFEDALLELPATDSAQVRSGADLLLALRLAEIGENTAQMSAPDIGVQSWAEIVERYDLSDEAKERFEKVLRVLLSSELLVGVVKDDLENVLQALAIAVK